VKIHEREQSREDGYDSFANVEDLCGPSGVEEEETENDRRRGT
jgi:hypothetical protein